MSLCGYIVQNPLSGSASEIFYDVSTPTRSVSRPLANSPKVRHVLSLAGFTAPEPAASATLPDRIYDPVRDRFPAYLRCNHGTFHDARCPKCDLDSWSGTRRRLAPARSL